MAVEAGLSVYVVGGQGVRDWEDFCIVMYVIYVSV